MVVHEDDVFAGLGRARMEVFIIEKQGGCGGREFQLDSAIGLAAALVGYPNDDELEVRRGGFVHAMAIKFRIPLVARALRSEAADGVGRALEDGRTRVRAGIGSAHVGAEDITNPRLRFGRVNRHVWEKFGGGQHIVVFIGVKAGGRSELPKLADADGISRLGFGPAEGGQEQSGKDAYDGDDDEELDQGEGRKRAREERNSFRCAGGVVGIRWPSERALPPHPPLRRKHCGGQAYPLRWGEGVLPAAYLRRSRFMAAMHVKKCRDSP
jgi:hypothetical protein